MDILFEIFVTDLLQATNTQFKSNREEASDDVNVISIRFTPSYNRKTLLCVARTKSRGGSNTYITKIELQNVEFLEDNMVQDKTGVDNVENDQHDIDNNTKKEQDSFIEITCSDNRKIKIKPQLNIQCNIRLNCNCLDYFQRMASYNKTAKVLIGRKVPTHYQSPTTPANKLKGNPNNSPGMCKHLVALYYRLMEMGIITEF